jgi:hypothetical protein
MKRLPGNEASLLRLVIDRADAAPGRVDHNGHLSTRNYA